jgi:hypothetical protein
MKRTLFATGLFAVIASLSYGQKMVAEIPFNFELGKTSMPAGTYTVEQSGLLTTVRCQAEKISVMTLTEPTERHRVSAQPSLEFQRYGNEYFLSKIWTGDAQEGHALPKSAKERKLARNADVPKLEEVALTTDTLQTKNIAPKADR